MKRAYETRGPGPKQTNYKLNPQPDQSPEGNTILVISDKWHEIRVLLDSGSNIILLNQNTARTLKVPYEIREKRIKITAFKGEVSSTRGKYYSHLIQLEISTNGHTTMVPCESADPGKYDMLILLGWWHHEHPLNISKPWRNGISNRPNVWNLCKMKPSPRCLNGTRR